MDAISFKGGKKKDRAKTAKVNGGLNNNKKPPTFHRRKLKNNTSFNKRRITSVQNIIFLF